MSKLWVVEFAVQASSELNVFPMDMMRYDRCTPQSQEDVDQVVISESPLLELKPIPINMVHYSHGDKQWLPTVKRWESFGWRVVNIRPAYSV